ncbi:efflux RND transporter periplasmic adaptor subunit [Acidithiobacillus sp. IBUN Pt1247-S3]|uniref:efflux RND transporter periplasmic adaptor subunit n=1 Tax=Acidithiobacillus sp. IBUN Pt1247-S3 TaxID=3166642 RepID=UPI0034E4E1F7
MKAHRWGAIALFLALPLFLSACQKAERSGPAPVQVTLVQPKAQDMIHYESFLGTVTPLQTVNIVPQTSGQLASLSFTQGGMVQQGQTLFTINPAQAAATLAQARANLASARATAHYNQTLVEQDQPLVEKDFITKQSYAQAVSQAQASQAQVAADAAAVQQAQITLGYTRITAPISGRIGMALVKPGNLVVANQTQLATINQISPIGINFQIPQSLLGAARMAKEQAWKLMVDDEKQGKSLDTAILHIIDNSVSATTATVSVQAQADNAGAGLWPGEFVEVRLPVQQVKQALTLPVAAVQQGSNGNFVYQAPKGVVQATPVQVLWEDGQTAVISGLPVDAQVIDPVPARVYAGVHVFLPGQKAPARTEHGHRHAGGA